MNKKKKQQLCERKINVISDDRRKVLGMEKTNKKREINKVKKMQIKWKKKNCILYHTMKGNSNKKI